MSLSYSFEPRPGRWLITVLICGLCFTSAGSYATTDDSFAETLRAKYQELQEQLQHNQFKRALYLDSSESSDQLNSEIYTVVDYPFHTVNAALNNPEHWCDVLILHINVKSCHVSHKKAGPVLAVNIGRKHFQPLEDTFRLALNYREVISKSEYFALELNAKDGPLSTHDYRIRIEATAIDAEHSFLHFTYAYGFGTTGRLAMQGYLMTLGKDKVGFTITGQEPNGQPNYIQGVRGAVERNAMRYYLAIDAYLAGLSSPPEQQLKARLQHWYNAIEQYALQLRDIEREEYLVMKRREYQRQKG